MLGGTLRNNSTAAVPSFRPQINDPVCAFDDIQVMLNNDNGIAFIDKPLQNRQQLIDIIEMESCSRLIQDIYSTSVRPLLQFCSKLHTLAFPSGQCRGRLSETDIAKSYIDQGIKIPCDPRIRFEEISGLFNGHIKDIRHSLPVIGDFQRFPVVPFAMAYFTIHIDIGKEIHFDFQGAVAMACFASPAFDIERESAGAISAHLGLRCLGKKLAYLIPYTGICGRIRTRCAANRVLVHVDDFPHLFKPFHPGMPAGDDARTVKLISQHRVQYLIDQCGFPGS